MIRRFFRDGLIYAISSVFSRGVSVLLIPILTRFLSPSEYGTFDILMIGATLANYCVTLEISQGFGRFYSEAKDEQSRCQCVSTAAWFCVLAYFVFIATCFPLSSKIAQFLIGSDGSALAVQILVFAIAANGIFFFLQDVLRWQIKPVRYAVASVSYSVAVAIFGVISVVIFDMGIEGLLLGQVVGALLGLLVTWFAGSMHYWRSHFSLSKLTMMLGYSAPQVVSSCSAYLVLYVDRFFIREFISLEDAGVYGVGARLASLVGLLMVGFQSSFIPLIFKDHSDPSTPANMAILFRVFSIFAISLIMFLSGFSFELLVFLATENYYRAWPVIPIISSAILFSSMFIFVPGVFIAKKTILVAAINVFAVIFVVLANAILVPKLGIFGASFASLATGILVFFIYFLLNKRFYPIPFEWRRIVLAVIVGVFACLVLMSLQRGAGLAFFLTKGSVFLIGMAIVAVILLDKEEAEWTFARFKALFRR